MTQQPTHPLLALVPCAALAAFAVLVALSGCDKTTQQDTGVAPVITPGTPTTPVRIVPLEPVDLDPAVAVPSRPVTAAEIVAEGPLIRCIPIVEVGGVEPLAPMPDGETMLVRTVADEACGYTLGLMTQDGQVSTLVEIPASIYNAQVHPVGGATVVVWTEVNHGPWKAPVQGNVLTSKEVDPVLMAMVRDAEGQWHAPSRLLDLPEAVWLGGIFEDNGQVRMAYWHDSLFEHLLFDPTVRPATDGLYTVALRVVDARAVVKIDEAVRVRDYLIEAPNVGFE